MRLSRPKLLLVYFLVASLPAASVKAQTPSQAFGTMQEAIARARAAMPEEARVRRIFEDVVYLQSLSPRLHEDDAEEFARSLQHDAAMLDEAVAATSAERIAILSDIEADLAVKRSAGTGLGAGTAFRGRVSVTVVTRRRTPLTDAPGYVITMNPVRWRGSSPMYRLLSLSPAKGMVPPGRYEVAASGERGRVAADVVRIGLDAENENVVELPVP